MRDLRGGYRPQNGYGNGRADGKDARGGYGESTYNQNAYGTNGYDGGQYQQTQSNAAPYGYADGQQSGTQYSEETVEDKIRNYSGKSESDLMQTLLQQVAASRRAGTLSDTDLDGFASTAAMMLSGDQLTKLHEIIAMLKRV